MKKFLLFIFMFTCVCRVSAIDFVVDGLYYYTYQNSEDSVKVHKPYNSDALHQYDITGALKIPAYVTYNSKSYVVAAIGPYAFKDCTGLTSVELPSSIKQIEYGSFEGCTGLTRITIPPSVVSIGDCAFADCTGLTEIKIPSSVVNIGDAAFAGCTSLTELTIPNSVTRFGSGLFRRCGDIKNLKLPSTPYMYESGAFIDYTGLRELHIPDGVTTIAPQAFYGCTGLTELFIPKSVTAIWYNAFEECTGLRKVILEDAPISIEKKAYYDPNASHPMTWPDIFDGCPIEYVYLGRYSSFAFGETLRTAILGEYITQPSRYTFEDCYNLKSLTLPRTFKCLKSWTLKLSKDLETINVYAPEPPELQSYALSAETYATATLHILKGTKQLYSEAPYWCLFNNVIDDLDVSGVDNITEDSSPEEIIVYNLQGHQLLHTMDAADLNTLPAGIYIKRTDRRIEKIVIP